MSAEATRPGRSGAGLGQGELPAYPAARLDPLDVPPDYLALIERSPVTRVRLPTGSAAWLITGYDAARQALGHPLLSADATRAGFPQFRGGSRRIALRGQDARKSSDVTFIQMDPPHHDELRGMLRGSFAAKPVAAARPALARIAGELLDSMIEAGSPADLVASLASPFPALVMCEMLGVPAADREVFEHEAQRIMSLSLPQRETLRALRTLMGYIDQVVREAEAGPSDGLIGCLVRDFLKPGKLDHDDLAATIRLLLVAGIETTANMIGLCFACLLRDTELYGELCRDPHRADGIVDELLRFMSIAHHGVRRIATADVVIGGTAIARGEGVIISVAAANRDPGAFTDPNRVDLGRDARRHLSFSYGVHYCLGHILARAELEVVLTAVSARLPGLRLHRPVEELSFRGDALVYGVRELPVAWLAGRSPICQAETEDRWNTSRRRAGNPVPLSTRPWSTAKSSTRSGPRAASCRPAGQPPGARGRARPSLPTSRPCGPTCGRVRCGRRRRSRLANVTSRRGA
jgi:cytochrome P450